MYSKKIIMLINNKEFIDMISKNAVKKVNHNFSINLIVNQYKKLYENVLNEV